MSNPFGAAIHALQETIKDYGIMGVPEVCDSCRAALNVLEAAGKVDKHSAICSMRHSDANESWSGLDEDWVTINALLAALPDEVKK